MDQQRRTKNIFILSALSLIIIVLVFTGSLNIASFKQNYTESLVSGYAVAGGETVRNVEYAVKYGKPLTNFLSIEELLQETIEGTPSIEKAQIVLTDGQIIYDQNGEIEGQYFDDQILEQINFIDSHDMYHLYVLDEEKYHVFLPIHDKDDHWIGSLALTFDQSIVTVHTNTYMWELIYYLFVFAIMSLLCLLIFTKKVSIVSTTGQINKKRILMSLIILLGIIQIIYGVINYSIFNQAYEDIAQDNTSFTAQVIQKDIDAVINKGVTYEQLYSIEDYLESIIQSVPVVSSINISNLDNQVLYSTLSEDNNTEPIDSKYLYTLALEEDPTGNRAKLDVEISAAFLTSNMREIILDMVTILVTSFLFMVELTLFIIIFLAKKLNVSNVNDALDESRTHTVPNIDVQKDTEIAIVRPLAFLLFMGIFMSVSFIPVVMKNLYEPMWGISQGIIIGLPITSEMFFAGLTTIIAGYLIDKKGWRVSFYLGLFIVAIGTLLSGLAQDALFFILARGVVGAGYGFSLMALRGFVNTTPSTQRRTSGLASLFAGVYAGLNCGVIVGAMLADRIGFSQVFFVAFGAMVLTGLFAYFNLSPKKNRAFKAMNDSSTKQGKISLLQFFTQRQVLGLFVLIVLPTAISGMFLDYYFPIFAAEEGLSASNVGRAFLLNGLCIVYLAPLLSKYLMTYLGELKSIIFAGLIIVLALLLFSWQSTILVAFIAIILLGLSDSFGLVAQNNYFLRQKVTHQIGEGKALGYFDNVRKTGQMIGPIIFGTLITLGVYGIGLLGFIFLVTLILFLIIGRDVK